ncbi:MAG: 23S rRNA (adenine(2503)-C(2))-methyltransferase RlmN [Bacteroidales bacterium]|jgi:23S rRNA (adenine2503-C2)-methyltransferase|nr:23S rRNA (adenine(2503)-C(2))-methyltransferase RlmN [Bacteroidales bacterium]
MKQALFGKTVQELSEMAAELSLPRYAAKQIAGWLYRRQVSSIDAMTDLSAKTRELLNARYVVGLQEPEAVKKSKDGTKKYLFPVADGKYVEAAYIPDRDRATLCISSQVGCRMGCAFCMTGKQGMNGNLTSTDILNQFRSLPEQASLTNIVFMGMGEPFDNLPEVMKSLEILTADDGYAWAPKRITVSTIGILPAVKHFMENSRCHIAISLHHPVHEERKRLMPVENKYPIQQIIAQLKTYDLNRQRRISFEYVMLAGINDSLREAKEMVKLLSGLQCRINLIPFHAIPDSPFKPSGRDAIQQFDAALQQKGMIVTVRQSRGLDIDAACGMLSTTRKWHK